MFRLNILNVNKSFFGFINYFKNQNTKYLALNPKRIYSNEQKNLKIAENGDKKQNNSSVNQQAPKIEISPIRKLIRVKDYLDMLIFFFLALGIYIGYKNLKKKQENEQKFNIEWLNIPLLKHKIFTCNGFYLPEFIARHLSQFKEFKVRKDDVWIVSFPKSGLLKLLFFKEFFSKEILNKF